MSTVSARRYLSIAMFFIAASLAILSFHPRRQSLPFCRFEGDDSYQTCLILDPEYMDGYAGFFEIKMKYYPLTNTTYVMTDIFTRKSKVPALDDWTELTRDLQLQVKEFGVDVQPMTTNWYGFTPFLLGFCSLVVLGILTMTERLSLANSLISVGLAMGLTLIFIAVIYVSGTSWHAQMLRSQQRARQEKERKPITIHSREE